MPPSTFRDPPSQLKKVALINIDLQKQVLDIPANILLARAVFSNFVQVPARSNVGVCRGCLSAVQMY